MVKCTPAKQICCNVHSAIDLPEDGHVSGRNLLEDTL